MLGINQDTARHAWSVIVVIAITAALFIIRKTLLVFIIAVLLSYLLFPLVEFLYHRISPRSRTVAALIPFVLFLSLAVLTGYLLHPRIVREQAQLEAQITSAHFKSRLQAWTIADVPVGRLLVDNYSEILALLPRSSVQRGLRATFRDTGNLVIIPILSFFFLRDGKEIRDYLLALLFGSECHTPFLCKGREVCVSLLTDAHALILDYMRTLLLQCMATFIAYSIVLSLLRVPYAILLALVAFPLEFVPLVGPLTSAVLILGVCEFNLAMNPDKVQHLHFFAVLTFLLVYRIFQDYILSPALMKKGVKLHPLVIIFGVYAGGEIGGIGGIFLSVPILALSQLIFYEWRKPSISPAQPAFEKRDPNANDASVFA